MNVAHKLGIKHARYIASLRPANPGDLHDIIYPFTTKDWFGSDTLHDDYWAAFWITMEDLNHV